MKILIIKLLLLSLLLTGCATLVTPGTHLPTSMPLPTPFDSPLPTPFNSPLPTPFDSPLPTPGLSPIATPSK